MKIAVDELLLPDSIAQYVETFGEVKLSNGTTVIPLFKGILDQPDYGFLNPTIILERINRRREEDGIPPYPIVYGWFCPRIITQYSIAVARALKNAIALRSVDNKILDGRNELLAGFIHGDHMQLECIAYDKISVTECQLGAAMRIRFPELVQEMGVPFVPVYGAPSINPESVLIAHFMRNLRMVK